MPIYSDVEEIQYKLEPDDLKLGNTFTLEGKEYTIQVIGAYAESREREVGLVPSRDYVVVSTPEEGRKIIFNLKFSNSET